MRREGLASLSTVALRLQRTPIDATRELGSAHNTDGAGCNGCHGMQVRWHDACQRQSDYAANQLLLSGRGVFMYVKHAPDATSGACSNGRRRLPALIFCYAGAEPDNPKMSSTQRCLDLDIREDPAPKFHALQPLAPTWARC